MSVEVTREAMTAYLLALLDGGGYARYLSPGVTLSLRGTGHGARGRGAVGGMLARLHGEAFDGAHEIRRLVCEGGRAAVEARFAATPDEDCAGIRPTGAGDGVPYVGMYELEGVLIQEVRLYVPVSMLLEQRGEAQEAGHADIRKPE